jgi:arginine-tRNA-protein transferase
MESSPEHDCVYLPRRRAITRAFRIDELPPSLYHDFMDAGFRRSGRVIYQPICSGCRACLPIRVSVAHFTPDKSQRRCARRNADLRVQIGPPVPTQEKYELYRRYLHGRHGDDMGDDPESFESFLYESPVRTLECCYREAGGRLLAVGICDVCQRSLSTVYFYFEPSESRRGLGTFGSLYEIGLARQMGIEWYYLGFWVRGCASMEYKASFRPNQVLHPDGVWREEGQGE